jgi:hypothetical protein
MSKKRRKSIVQEIMEEARKVCNKQRYQNNVTRKLHLSNIRKFVLFCRENFDSKKLSECLPHVQEYCDYLVNRNLSPYSVHLMISSCCSPLNNDIKLRDIIKPKRKISEIKRGRDLSKRTITALNDSSNSRVSEFSRRCGIRKNEYKLLTNSDFIYDEELKAFFVQVKRGKGGRYQLQRILDEDVDFIKKYFDPNGDPDARIFRPNEVKKLNLHRLRALHAQEAYEKLEKKLLNDSEFAKVLEKELEIYWQRFKGTPFPREKMTKGYYYLRGDVRKDAIARGRRTCYNRLITNWISGFLLAHSRPSVCVQNYLLV